MKIKRLWIFLTGVVIIGAAFLLLNFRVAASKTSTEKLISTTDMGENMPVPMQRKDKISIILVGEGPMVRALQKALKEQMVKAEIGEVDLVQEPGAVYQNPVLVVKIGKPDPTWTPFFAISRLSIHAGYASDGDYTFMKSAEETHTSVGKIDVSNMYAEYDVNDRSFGLISRTGYHQFLADYLAQEIVTVLKDLYHVQKTILTPTSQVLESTPTQTSVDDTSEFFSSDQLGLCFSYPRGYTQVPGTDAVEITAPDLPDSAVKGLFWLEISDSYDRTAEEIADQEMTYALDLSVDRWTVMIDGEQAVVLDGIPGQELQRRVYVVRQQTLYILAFWPARSENKAASDQMEALYTAVTSSWTWSPCSLRN